MRRHVDAPQFRCDHGEQLFYDERLLLTRYMNSTGWNEDVVVGLFRRIPGFTGNETRSQVVHSARRRRKPASCLGLRGAGMCPADCGEMNPASLAITDAPLMPFYGTFLCF
jgi:DNA primase large subunit